MNLIHVFLNFVYLTETTESIKNQFDRMLINKVRSKDYITLNKLEISLVHAIYIENDRIFIKRYSLIEPVATKEIDLRNFVTEDFSVKSDLLEEIFKIICEFNDRNVKFLYLKNVQKCRQLKDLTENILNHHKNFQILSRYFCYKQIFINNPVFEELFDQSIQKKNFYIWEKNLFFYLDKTIVEFGRRNMEIFIFKFNLEDFAIQNFINSDNFKNERNKKVVNFMVKKFNFSKYTEKSNFKCTDEMIFQFINRNILQLDADLFSRKFELIVKDNFMKINDDFYKIDIESSDLPINMFDEILNYLLFISNLDYDSVKIIFKLMNLLEDKDIFSKVVRIILNSKLNGRKKLFSTVLYSLGKITESEYYWLEFINGESESSLVEDIIDRFMTNNIFIKAMSALNEEIYCFKKFHLIFIIYLEISDFLKCNVDEIIGLDMNSVLLKDLPFNPNFKMPFKILNEFESSNLDFSQDNLFITNIKNILRRKPTFDSLQ